MSESSVHGLLSPAAFWTPEHAVDSAWYQHAPFAFWLMDAFEPDALVELGTHHGFSYLVFCQAVDRLQLGTRCYAIDHWKGDEHAGFYDEDVLERLRAIHDPRYGGFSELIQTTFEDAARHFSDGTVDLLHIDGAHRIEDVTRDFSTWRPKMSDRGVVLFHDINVHRDDFGVYELWERLRQNHPHFSFDHGHGLGVLGVGPGSQDALGHLFGLQSAEEGKALRVAFARLGAAIEDRIALQAQRAKAERASVEVDRLADEVAELRHDAERAREKASLRQQELEELQEELFQQTSELMSLQSHSQRRNRELEGRVAHLNAELWQARNEVEELLSSRSWRITAPVRASARGARRLAGLIRRGLKVVWWTLTLQLPRRLEAYRRFRAGIVDAPTATLATEIARYSGPGPFFEDAVHRSPSHRTANARVIAFYLPQYHAIPENDEWWGQGFTEWRNTVRGIPRFVGHVQPRVPRDLGYYDLSDPSVMPEQIARAKAAGIDGLCFYYYRFTEGRLLEHPIEDFLSRPELEMPFCLMWANENWTRTWDGLEHDVLRGHDYEDDMERALLEDMVRHFEDPRYIRIDDRPLFIVYRPGLIPDAAAAFARWRRYVRDAIGAEPMLLMAQAFDDHDPRAYGLDGAVEFPPHKLARDLPERRGEVDVLDAGFSGSVRYYEDLVEEAHSVTSTSFPLCRTVVPSWDNEARRPGRGLTFAGSTPLAYERWLRDSIRFARRNPLGSQSLVFVNAWNEWAEGAYLEPDVYFGSAYLNATRRAVYGPLDGGTKRRLVLVGHDAAPHGAQMLLLNIGRVLRRQFGVEVAFVLLEGGSLLPEYEEIATTRVSNPSDQGWPAVIEGLRNRGFDRAVLNTSVTGFAAEALAEAGFDTTVLIHEMASFIHDRGWESHARAAARNAQRLVFADGFVAERFAAVAPEARDKAIIRPQGMYHDVSTGSSRDRVRAELGVADDELLVIGVGYADLRKGFDLFVAGARQALESGRKLRFAWIGGIEPTLRSWLLEGGRGPKNLQSIPFTSDVGRYYIAADALFLSSREDAFPSTVLEALSHGLPVVGFAGTTGTAGLIAETGAVVSQFDIDDVLDAIETVAAGGAAEASRRRRLVADRFRFDDYVFDLLAEAHPGTPRISVAVPNYNYAQYLPRRLESIFEQTHPILEILVLDDGSTDDSVEVIQQVAADHGRDVTVVVADENSGSVFAQWAKAAAATRGDLLWIAEADDEASPTLLDHLAAEHEPDGKTVLAWSDSISVDADGRRVGHSYHSYLQQHSGDVFDGGFRSPGQSLLADHLAIYNPILNASAVLFRRNTLLEVLARDLDDLIRFRFAGDWRVYAELCQRGDVAYVAEPLNIHRRHGGGATFSTDSVLHVGEIARMHEYLRLRLGDADLEVRQKSYRDFVASELSS